MLLESLDIYLKTVYGGIIWELRQITILKSNAIFTTRLILLFSFIDTVKSIYLCMYS